MSYIKGAGGLKTLLTGTPRYQIVLLVDAGDTILKIWIYKKNCSLLSSVVYPYPFDTELDKKYFPVATLTQYYLDSFVSTVGFKKFGYDRAQRRSFFDFLDELQVKSWLQLRNRLSLFLLESSLANAIFVPGTY